MKKVSVKQPRGFFASNVEFQRRVDAVRAGIEEAVDKEMKDQEEHRREVVQVIMDKINRANASLIRVLEGVSGFKAYLNWYMGQLHLDNFGENPTDACREIHGAVLVVKKFGFGNYEHTPSLAIRARDQTRFILTEVEWSDDLRMLYEKPSNGEQLGFLESKTVLDYLDRLATPDKCLDEMIRCLEHRLHYMRTKG